MSSSNETFRRSRVFSYVAGGLAAFGLAGIGVLVFQVNDLSERYGQIERDIEYFETQRTRLLTSRQEIQSAIALAQAELAAETSRLAQAKADAEAASVAKAAALDDLQAARKDLAQVREDAEQARQAIDSAEKDRATFQQLSQQLLQLEREVANKTRDKEAIDSELLASTADLTKLRDELEDLRSLKETLDTDLDERRAEVEELASLQARVDRLRKEDADLTKKLTDGEARAKSLASENEADQTRVNELQAQIDAALFERDKAVRESGIAGGQLANLTAEVDSLRQKQDDIQRKADAAQELLRRSELDQKAVEDTKTKIEAELRTADLKLQETLKNLTTAQTDLNAAQNQLEKINADIQSGQSDLAELDQARSELAGLTGQKSALAAEVIALQTSKGALDTEIASATLQLQELRESLQRFAAREGRAAEVESDASRRLEAIKDEIKQAEASWAQTKTALDKERQALADIRSESEQLSDELELLKTQKDRLRTSSPDQVTTPAVDTVLKPDAGNSLNSNTETGSVSGNEEAKNE